MTDTDWLACAVPDRILAEASNTTGRKMILFGCACCRRVRHTLSTEAVPVIDQVEACADKLNVASGLLAYVPSGMLNSTSLDIAKLMLKAHQMGLDFLFSQPVDVARRASHDILGKYGLRAFDGVAETCPDVLLKEGEFQRACEAATSARAAEAASQCHLLRDILGNPFRPVTVDPAWRAWNDGTVVKLAQAIYDERALPSGHLDAGRLAILADALEETGCANADILSHCRAPGPHVRGCWVVDLLLGKE